MSCSCKHGAGDKRAQTLTAGLQRPRYSPGLILEDADLTAAVEYTRELNRLLFRSLFGCGVICGLTASVREDCGLQVTVNAGLALDSCGDPIQLTKPVTIALQKVDGVIADKPGDAPRVKDFWLVLCGGEKPCAPRRIECDAQDVDGSTQMTRIQPLAEVSITFERPECACGCEKPPKGKPDSSYYPDLANKLLPPAATAGAAAVTGAATGGAGGTKDDLPDCHVDHRTAVDCPADCGCGSACGCGCCILLAWVHWFEPVAAVGGTGGETGGWGVLHRGVRRFLRPTLISDDPAPDKRPGATPVLP